MTPQGSATLAEILRAALVTLRVPPADRERELREAAEELRRSGVADADAHWLAARWARNLDELADALTDAAMASYALTGVVKEMSDRTERNGNGKPDAPE